MVAVPRGEHMPLSASRYLFCQGLLRAKRIEEQSAEEVAESFRVNATDIIAECYRLLLGNYASRICVIGSESGYGGSYDGAYAMAKSMLHSFIEHQPLNDPSQQLVCIAPSIIEDCSMTEQRRDRSVLTEKRAQHQKRRFMRAIEVARLVKFLLYEDEGYLTGTIIRMHGGKCGA